MKKYGYADEVLNPLYSCLLKQESGMEDLVLCFMERLPSMFDAIALSHQQSDWPVLTRQVHDMKSVGGGYGYPQISEVSSRIEYALQQDTSQIAYLIQELEVICMRALQGADTINQVKQQA